VVKGLKGLVGNSGGYRGFPKGGQKIIKSSVSTLALPGKPTIRTPETR
jgi:hypothetical protein